MKIALILGGKGLIGQALVTKLAEQNYQVFSADRAVVEQENGSEFKLDIFDEFELRRVLTTICPDLIINCVNIATICSQQPDGVSKVTNFYISLYQALHGLINNIHYIQVGTTGSGGLGLNIPFTHGQDLKDLPILRKAAFAGISTSLLTLLSRSFSKKVTISEIKPGLAIFDPTIHTRINSEFELTTLDGGESGHYTYDELALLTSFMGFTEINGLVKKIMAIIEHKTSQTISTRYDVINSLNSTIINQEGADSEAKEKILSKMGKSLSPKSVIATGNLGPPTVAQDLLLAHLLVTKRMSSEAGFAEQFRNNSRIQATLAYLNKHNEPLFRFLTDTCTFSAFTTLSTYFQGQTFAWELVRDKLKVK